MRVAVIPARGGSKRIPRKNVKLFFGKPMIAWSIEAAIHSGCFDRVVVSTDDEEIAEIAKTSGAEVPFIRPASLSDDFSGTIPVIAHAIESLGITSSEQTLVCCIYATAPFVRSSDLSEGLSVMQNSCLDYAFSTTNFAYPVQRALKVDSRARVAMVDENVFNVRSQDLEELWHDAGQFYWGTAQAWLSQLPIFSSRAAAIKIPRSRAQDIDTQEDWEFAELLFEVLSKK